jgi:hypothetical protein
MTDDETDNKPADIEAVRAERKAAKRQAKEKRKAEKPAATPEAVAARTERKALKRQAKEERKAEKPAATPEALAARTERKAAKRQAKETRKAEKPAAAPEAVAARTERKALKRQTKEERKAAKPAASPEAQAQRAERKEVKRRNKEAEKAARAEKSPEAQAAKAERKATKRQAKETVKAAREAKSSEVLAAKAERKAGKQKAKETGKAEREAVEPAASAEAQAQRAERKEAKHKAKEAKKEKTPEALAAKAERKEAKHKAKEAKKEKTPEELAAKAERKKAKHKAKEAKKEKTPEALAAKAERKEAKHKAKEAKKEKTPEALAAKAERKDAKHKAKEAKKEKTPEELAAKAERKAAKAKDATPELSEADKAARKEAKKKAKAERKADKPPEKTPEDRAAKAERKAKKKTEKGAGEEDGLSHEQRKLAKKAAKQKAREEGGERTVRLNVAGRSPEDVAPLAGALQVLFAASGTPTEAPKPEGKADVVVHTFDDADPGAVEHYAAAVAAQKARVHVFVEKLEEGGAVNRAIARLAASSGGAVVSTHARLKRFGLEQAKSTDEKAVALIAEAVVGIGAARLTKHIVNPPARMEPADLAEARASAAQPMELLGKLRWSAMAPPKAIGASIHQEDVVAFADSKIVVSEEASLALGTPVDWGMELPARKAGTVLNGLDFLSSPLAYWYAKANNQGSERTAAIDAALKERGTNPNALFARAAQILADFIAKHPRSAAPLLWEETLVRRRASVLAMFVLCCRVAYRRKLKFDENVFTAVFCALLDHAEMLRADDFYIPCSLDGIEQDTLTIGIALSLRGTPYGSGLMSGALERLKRLQLDPGLSAEGVWLGDSYGTHNSVISEITGLFADFPPNETALLEPFAATAKKMTLFSEAMLKSNGQPPAFDGSKEKSYGNKVSSQRKSIARASGKQVTAGKSVLRARITDTYVFREAQYFISHSQQKIVPESSLVVLHAAAPSVAHEDPGGMKLVFAYNDSNLLIRAEPPEAQGEEEPDETDPALRNFYRVAGKGNLTPESGSDKAARMVKSWRGQGWAAAKAFENNYEDASVARTVIHLKAQHALIVVDELASGGDALFESFWNVGPDFVPPGTMAMPLLFTSAGKGVLGVVLAGTDEVSAAKSEARTALRAAVRSGRGVTAALFQWTEDTVPAALAIERRGGGEWAVTASGKGFSARLNHTGNELTCDLAEG